MNKQKVIIDSDPGVDDALAIFLLSQAKNIDIKLLVACCGNSGIENTFANFNYLKKLFKIDAPIVAGEKQTLTPEKKRIKIDIKKIHGKYTGLGNLKVAEKSFKVDYNYCEAIKKVLDENDDVTYIVFGPLTNLAMFLKNNPTYKTKLKKVVFMGGVKDKVVLGHVYSEFNIGMDSDAAKMLLKQKLKNLVMVPSELGHFAYFSPMDVEKIRKTNALGQKFGKMFDGYFDRMVPRDCVATHDACVAAYLIDSSFFKQVSAKIKVKYFKEIDCSVMVNNVDSKRPNCTMVVDLEEKKFRQMFFKYLKDFEK